MAKRELIDRKQAVEVVSNGFDRWHMINLLASQESIPAITEQEIVKPILDKIRAEIEKQEKWLLQAGYNTYNVDIAFNSIKLALAESEVENGNG